MSDLLPGSCAEGPKFLLGHVVATPNVLTAVHVAEIQHALSRHVRGDWGELDSHDVNANDQALRHGGRLLSQFYSTQNVKFWIITEADRSVTTVLLPEDY